MPELKKMNGDPLPNPLTLLPGTSYPFKVVGLGRDSKHVLLQCDSALAKVEVVRASPHNSEQTLRLRIQNTPITEERRFTLFAYLASEPLCEDRTCRRIAIVVLPPLVLPDPNTEAGILARMLVVENITPGQKAFVSIDESKLVMGWMRRVLANRLSFGPRYFGAASTVRTLSELIKASGQVAGFESYPAIAKNLQTLLDTVLRIAGDPTHNQFTLYRQYVQAAIDVANETQPGADPCPTGLYAWRTAGTAGPGSNFSKFQTRGGQDFYTLTEGFRNDPNDPEGKHKKKPAPKH